MSKHTPGPWSYSKCPCRMQGCASFTISVQGSVGFEEGDARLISAAPDLLEALVSLAAEARRYLPDYDEHPEVQKADAAIEKAEGRS
jgi:hypothetical protein